MISSKDELMAAAKGTFKKKDPTAPAPTAPLSTATYRGAMTNQAKYGQTASDLIHNAAYSDALSRASGVPSTTMSQVLPAGAKEDRTQLYGNIINANTRALGGLNSKGKYGGFNSAADLQTAIEGNAINLSQTVPTQLRSAAKDFYGQLNAAYVPAMVNTAGTVGFDPQLGGQGNFRVIEEMSKRMSPEQAQKSIAYARKLSNWAGEQSKPAEEYLKTAQQLETTPMSTLASQIATRSFGMNPDLAAGKFSNLDSTYWKSKRDQQYTSQYGMPYAEYMATQKEGDTLVKGVASSQLEQATGFSSKAMASVTGMTVPQLSSQLTASVQYEDPASGTVLSGSGADALNAMKMYIQSGQIADAEKIMNDIKATPGAEGIYSLLKAYHHMAVIAPTKYDYQNAMYSVSGQ